MDGAFVNLVRGSRLKLYMGIDPDTTPTQFGKDYTYVSYGVTPLSATKKKTKKASTEEEKEGEVLLRVKCGPLKIHKYKVAVEASKSLYDATISLHFPRILEPEDSGELLIRARVDKEVDWEALGACVRIYQFT